MTQSFTRKYKVRNPETGVYEIVERTLYVVASGGQKVTNDPPAPVPATEPPDVATDPVVVPNDDPASVD